jgi:hypothetical protein
MQTWRRLLATAFLTGARPRVSASTRDLTLCQPLGSWLPISAGFRFHWDCFFSAVTRNIYRRQHNTSHFGVHTSRKTRHHPKHPVRGFSDATTVTCTRLPPDAVPTKWSCEPNRLVIPATVSQLLVIPTAPKPPIRWDDYVDGLPDWEQTLLQHVQFVDRTTDGDALASRLRWRRTLVAGLIRVSTCHTGDNTTRLRRSGLWVGPTVLPCRRVRHADDPSACPSHPVFLRYRQLRTTVPAVL